MGARALRVLVVLALGLFACEERASSAPEREREPPPRADFTPPPGFERLVISSTPYLDPEVLFRSHEPLAQYLSRHLKVPVEVVPANSYAALGEMMRDGRVDLGSFSPLSYVRARDADPGLLPLVNYISDGSPTSAGYIVVRADGPLRTLEDLRGRSFAWVDPSSTTGFLYPNALLRSKNIDPTTFFSRTGFLGNHEAALLAVHEGRYDGAAIFQGALPALKRNKGVDPLSFRIVAKTMRTPKDLFCARAGLPEEVATQIRRALLALTVRTQEGRAVLAPLNVNGFIPADDSQYDPVRAVEAQLAANPASGTPR